MSDIVIVGSGLAGFNLVREIRRIDTRVSITLITADTGDSYSKPMFSAVVANRQQPEQLLLAGAESQARFLGIKMLPNTVVEEIRPDNRQLICSRRQKVEYTQLVLANGASPQRPSLQGNALSHVHTLNTLEHFRRWFSQISALPRGTPILVIGSGHIAIEFVSELVNLGLIPHIVSPDPHPLAELLPEPVGEDLLNGLVHSGVEFHLGRTVTQIDTSTIKGRYLAQLDDGTGLIVGAVLAATGMEPNAKIAEQAGLAVRKGILVDRSMRTNLRGIYALGDVAEVEGLYMPYVTPLIQQAKVLASVLLGQEFVLNLPPPVIHVKCPLHPVLVCPVWQDSAGTWEYGMDSHGAAAYHRNGAGLLTGFALTRERVQERILLQASMGLLWN